MSTNADDPLRAELAVIRAAAEHALGVCDPEASVATLVDLLATEHRNLQARLVERVDSIVAHHDAEARRFDCAAASRPWPDYRALACEVFGDAGPPKDVAPAVAAWKALRDGQRVMCARGYQWTARRADGRLRFTMAKADGRPGKTVEQPWYPCIMARLPVWPIAIEAAD